VPAFAPYRDFLAVGTVQGATGEPGELRILSGAGDSGLELGYDYQPVQGGRGVPLAGAGLSPCLVQGDVVLDSSTHVSLCSLAV
jgi:hypothetical protein